MLLNLLLPQVNPLTDRIIINAVHLTEGAQTSSGTKFMDFTVYLNESTQHNCPAVSSYCLIIREQVWLRQLSISTNTPLTPNSVIGLFSTDQHESLDTEVARSIRHAIAGVVHQEEW